MNPYAILIEVGAGLVCLVIAAGVGYHFGGLSCRLGDATAVTRQEAHNEAQAATDTKAINQEAIDHAKALSAVPDPTPALICVRQYSTPRPVSQTTAPRGISDAPAALPEPSSPGFDPGPELAKIGQAADAQVIELQDYITKVCLAP